MELRYFGGLTVNEVATSLNISTATVKREWATAKAWIYRRLRYGTSDSQRMEQGQGPAR